jgi:hypothetical protein
MRQHNFRGTRFWRMVAAFIHSGNRFCCSVKTQQRTSDQIICFNNRPATGREHIIRPKYKLKDFAQLAKQFTCVPQQTPLGGSKTKRYNAEKLVSGPGYGRDSYLT